jgi:hypothetical protein
MQSPGPSRDSKAVSVDDEVEPSPSPRSSSASATPASAPTSTSKVTPVAAPVRGNSIHKVRVSARRSAAWQKALVSPEMKHAAATAPFPLASPRPHPPLPLPLRSPSLQAGPCRPRLFQTLSPRRLRRGHAPCEECPTPSSWPRA